MQSHLFKSSFFIISCFSLIACQQQKEAATNNPPPPVSVDIMVASLLPLHYEVEANGTVLPLESVEIHPEVSGRLTYLQVPDGAKVNAGSILARINDQELQAQVTKTRVQLSLAEKTESRMKKLLAIQAVQQAEYDQALSNLEKYTGRLAVASGSIG